MKNRTKGQNYSQIQGQKVMMNSLGPLESDNWEVPGKNQLCLPLNCLLVTVLTSRTGGPGNILLLHTLLVSSGQIAPENMTGHQ